MTERNKRALAQEIQEMALQAQWNNADQQLIADYLNGLKYTLFDVKEHYFAANKLATRLDAQNGNDDHVGKLLDIRDMPKPFYVPVADSKSARVFASSLQNLLNELRHALYPEWVELDLKHAHLTIIAYLFGAAQTQDSIERGISLWTEFIHFMDIESEKIAKPLVKKFVYSLAYGKDASEAWNKLIRGLQTVSIIPTRSLLEHPIIQEVSNAVTLAMQSIEHDGGMQGAYGFISKGNDDAKSILACVIQSYELALIAPIYRIALQEKASHHVTFDITLHSHDGVSILVKDGADIHAIQRKVQGMVSLQAEKYGIKVIGIEVK